MPELNMPNLKLLITRVKTEEVMKVCWMKEIVREKHLKELTSVVVNIVLKATNSIRISKDNLKPKADDMCTFILSNTDLLNAILKLFCNVISVMLDPTSVAKCVMICDRLIRFLGNNIQPYTNMFAAELFFSLLKALMTCVDEQQQDSMISLLSFIYGVFRKKTNAMKEILAQVPGMTPQKLKNFEDVFSQSQDEKDRRKKAKSLLSPICGMNKGASTKSKSILSLGQQQNQQNQQTEKKSKKPQSFLDDAAVSQLQNLFK